MCGSHGRSPSLLLPAPDWVESTLGMGLSVWAEHGRVLRSGLQVVECALFILLDCRVHAGEAALQGLPCVQRAQVSSQTLCSEPPAGRLPPARLTASCWA